MALTRFFGYFAAAYGTCWLAVLFAALLSQRLLDLGVFGLYGFLVIATGYAVIRSFLLGKPVASNQVTDTSTSGILTKRGVSVFLSAFVGLIVGVLLMGLYFERSRPGPTRSPLFANFSPEQLTTKPARINLAWTKVTDLNASDNQFYIRQFIGTCSSGKLNDILNDGGKADQFNERLKKEIDAAIESAGGKPYDGYVYSLNGMEKGYERIYVGRNYGTGGDHPCLGVIHVLGTGDGRGFRMIVTIHEGKFPAARRW